MSDESFQVHAPLEGPLSREAYFSPRSIRGLNAASRFAIGTAGLGGSWGPVDTGESVRVLLDAFERGFRLVDTAPAYGLGGSEEVVGRALREWSGEAPVLCTKLEPYDAFRPPKYAADWRASLQKQLDTSRRRFGGRRIDGLAMHDAEPGSGFETACHEFLDELERRGEIGAMGLGGGGPEVQTRHLATGRYRYAITFKRLTALSLQALRDTVPACRASGAAVVVGSGLFMGLLGGRFEAWTEKPPVHIAPVYVERARRLHTLADDAGLSLSRLALRFTWSMPAVDFVLAGASRWDEWVDTVAAFEAGPLPSDLYRQVWDIATRGPEPACGG